MKKNTVYFKNSQNMSDIEDESITLVITSPPYWNVIDYSKNGYQDTKISERITGQIGDIQDYDEYLNEMDKVWAECFRVLKPNGKLCINTPLMPIPKKYYSTHYNRDIKNINNDIEHHILTKTKFHLYDLFIWNRTVRGRDLMFGSFPYPGNFYAQNNIEFINIFVKDGPSVKKDEENRRQSKLTKDEWVEYTQQVWNITENQMEQSKLEEVEFEEFTQRIWTLPKIDRSNEAYGLHPAMMPEQIPYRLIRLYTFVNDIVLDPFLGSGTTAKIAKQLNRYCIGYEINSAFKPIIQSRLNDLFEKTTQQYVTA